MMFYKKIERTIGYKNSVLYKNNYSEYEKNVIDTQYEISKKHFENSTISVQIDAPYLWESPSSITNSIIEITNENGLKVSDNQKKLFSFLELVICKHVVIRFSDHVENENLNKLLLLLNNFNLHSILIILDYHKCYYSNEFGDIIMNDQVASRKILIFNSPFDKNIEDTMFFYKQERKKINYNKSQIEFSSNRELFEESQKHQTYFNRKIYVGKNGEVKNAPECSENFGVFQNLNSGELLKIINSSQFQKYWYTHKEICDVCKDCEYRHVCIDNRIPIQRNKKEWYHSVECNYNPYVGKWKGEKGYKTLKKCGVISTEKKFQIHI